MAAVNIADLTRAVDKFTPTGDTAADRLALETYEVQLSALDDGITAAAMAPATAPPHAHDAARTSRLARLLKLSTGGDAFGLIKLEPDGRAAWARLQHAYGRARGARGTRSTLADLEGLSC